MTLTPQDFEELDRRFATKQELSDSVVVLEKKIIGSERRVASRIEESEQRITASIRDAVANIAHNAEVENLKHRVGVLEQKVG